MFKFSDQTQSKTGKEFYHLANQLYPYAQKRLGFEKPASCVLVSDLENAQDPLGYTAYYNPDKAEVTIFSDGRHIKDMLRSFAHELVHHAQACRGDLENVSTEAGYAQKDDHMREMEREAYEQGNLIFRDWEDGYKSKLNESMQIDEIGYGSLMKDKFLDEEYGKEDYTGSTKPEQHNVTYYTARKIDPNAEAHHRLDVLSHNQAYDHSTLPYINKFEENRQPSPISSEFRDKIVSKLNLENPKESKKNWIGTAEWDGGEVSYFWVPRNKLFYLVEFSPTYGVELKNVFSTWYQVNSAGLGMLKKHGKGAEITTFNDR